MGYSFGEVGDVRHEDGYIWMRELTSFGWHIGCLVRHS